MSNNKITTKEQQHVYKRCLLFLPPTDLFHQKNNLNSYKKQSKALKIFKVYCQIRPFSDWLYSSDGAPIELNKLVEDFRNKAAHLSTFDKKDYEICLNLTNSQNGILHKIFKSCSFKP